MSAEARDLTEGRGAAVRRGNNRMQIMIPETRTARRFYNLAGVGIAAALLSYALYTQLVQGLEACPLCMFQRFALIGLGIVMLVAAVHAPVGKGARAYAVLGVIVAAVGAGIAAWHLRLQYLPLEGLPQCGPGTLEALLNTVQNYSQAVARAFTPRGECSEINWTFLGLSMPGWVLLWFIALGALVAVANWRPLSR